jgi:hypothetical protein
MKKTKTFKALAIFSIVCVSVFFISADNLDAPSVSGTSSDISDFYAFQGTDTDNFVFVANVQGLLPPGTPTEQAVFDEDVLLEFNIDTNNDLKEDLVIQAIKRNDYMYFFGPVAPEQTDNISQIATSAARDSVKISTTTDIEIGESNGKKFFAGPREDPFYFDSERYKAIANDTVVDSFNNPGTDMFAGKNVLSVVIEFPKSLLPSGTVGVNPFEPSTPIYNVWLEAKRKQ